MNPILMALLGGLFTWGVTALGAGTVFFFKNINQKVLTLMLGFASGIMIAASFWSLLLPALEMSEGYRLEWLPIIVGFAGGGLFIYGADKLLSKVTVLDRKIAESGKDWKRSILLVFAITLHNIPEGMAFGVAFGAAAGDPTAMAAAVALTVGIGLQNFPEGAAVSIPLRREGMSRTKSFMVGQLSAVVEPIAAVCGAAIVLLIQPVLPYMLSLAAGAMIYVVVHELIPEAQAGKNSGYLATFGALFGFMLMTLLDVALG